MFVLAETRKTTRGGDVLSVAPRSISQKIYAGVVKRVIDLLLCVVMVPLLLPVLLVLWLLVRRDGGPGLFIQPRVGRNGKVFQCFKFRTMVVNAEKVLEDMCAKDPAVAEEWLKYQKLSNDPRISKVGKVLRATSLDELPQIFNVLMGDMSLVGPRPFLPSQKALYDEAGGNAYYRLRPGITGAWQVFGRSATTFKARVEFDEAYDRKLSFVSDMGLILRTVTVVFCRTGK
ncbi:sugar transferase [Sinirhodobacter populi]|uniref:Sugar transferase n=1 Tax=Paenirhodobacter populi TaxID=2306993 RepID=A0A443JZT6_9RHOB|nr:sugar transferase [Sinirhodobacter populi]RWR26053.1 sugar transferase [Sinirhodobacter populi]